MNLLQKIAALFGRQYVLAYGTGSGWRVQRIHMIAGVPYTKKDYDFIPLALDRMGEGWKPLTKGIEAYTVMMRNDPPRTSAFSDGAAQENTQPGFN